MNTAQFPLSVKLGGKDYRFYAREIKLIPENLVESSEFKNYSTLVDMGVYREHGDEIKSQHTQDVVVIDDKSVEEYTETDTVVEEKPKPKRKRKPKTQLNETK